MSELVTDLENLTRRELTALYVNLVARLTAALEQERDAQTERAETFRRLVEQFTPMGKEATEVILKLEARADDLRKWHDESERQLLSWQERCAAAEQALLFITKHPNGVGDHAPHRVARAALAGREEPK